jgi:hypothetical protein
MLSADVLCVLPAAADTATVTASTAARPATTAMMRNLIDSLLPPMDDPPSRVA